MTPKQLAALERVKKDIEADLQYSNYDLGVVVALRYMARVITALRSRMTNNTPQNRRIDLVLTEKEYAFLCKILQQHNDEGPGDEGWKSDELITLITYIESVGVRD